MTKIIENGRRVVISRRAALGGAAAVAIGVVCAVTDVAKAQSKQAQADVQYVAKAPAGDKCSGCALFQPPEGCQGVDGKISPDGWCSIYTPKA